MAKYGSTKLTWHASGRRRPIRSIVLISLGLVLGVVVAGSILSIDNTANTAHFDTAQDVIGVTALAVGCILAAVCAVPGFRRLRRAAVAGTSEILVITGKRRFAVPFDAISRVVVTQSSEDTHLPGVVLVTGIFVGVPDGRSPSLSGQVGVIDVDDLDHRPEKKDRAWKIGLEIRRHVTKLAPDASSADGKFGYQTEEVRPAGIEPPHGAIVTMTRKNRGKTNVATRSLSILILPFFFAFQSQQGTSHAFNVAQFFLALLAIVASEGLVLGILYSLTMGELRLGPDWIATRRNLSSKWTVVHRRELAGVVLFTSAKRAKAGTGGTVEISNALGTKLSLTSAWLTEPVASQILEIMNDLALWGPGAQQYLVGRSRA
jgi:hypothetical protein